MTTPEPSRLLARKDLPEAQRSLLEAGTRPAVDYDSARGEERFLAQLAVLDATQKMRSARGKLLQHWTLWTGLGVLLLGAVMIATRTASDHREPPASAAQPPILRLPEQVLPIAEPLPTAQPGEVEEAAAPAPSPPLKRERRRPARELARAPEEDRSATQGAQQSRPAAPSPSGVPREVEMMSEARRLLTATPERCFALLAEIARQYPNGYLVEEREALTVLALVRIGRREQARERAQRFLRSYPDGPYADRVRSASPP